MSALGNIGAQKPSFKDFGFPKRRSVSLQSQELVKISFLDEQKRFPLVVQPAIEGLNLIGWAEDNKEFLDSNLLKHGAILFRHFGVQSVEDFEQFIQTASGQLLEYT